MKNITKRQKAWNEPDIKNFQPKYQDNSDNYIGQILDFIRLNKCKFNESFDIIMKLKINTNNFNLQTAVPIPNAIKQRDVVIFGDDEHLIKQNNFEYGDVQKIKNKTVAVNKDKTYLTSTDYFKHIAPIAKQLATKKSLPLKKTNTIVDNMEEIWSLADKFKKGNIIIIRNNKAGYLSFSFGKCSMSNQESVNNLKAILDFIVNKQNCPIDFDKKISISGTMSHKGFIIPANIIKSLI